MYAVRERPQIRVEQLGPQHAAEYNAFFAETWHEWYNGKLNANLYVGAVAEIGNRSHVNRQRESLADPLKVHYGAFLAGKLVGQAYFIVEDSQLVLEEWNVAEKQRRQRAGVGRALLTAGMRDERIADLPNNKPFYLEVLSGSPTISTYKNMGLQKTETVPYLTVSSEKSHDIMTGTKRTVQNWLSKKDSLIVV